MNSTRSRLVIFAGCLFLPIICAAKAPSLPLQYERFTLANGLTAIVNEEHSSPLVSVVVRYRVGSRDEPESQTGFAHLFEHLMFNGSEHYDGEWFAPLQEAGAAEINGETRYDQTDYHETVPTPALDRALWMESDRMGHLLGALTQARLDEQREVVQNEYRENENQPYGRLFKRLDEALFPLGHPYHHAVIGSMKDLSAASLEQVRQWFRDYYGPNNAVVVLSGDIDPATAREKVERYFGAIPAGRPIDGWREWLPARACNTHDIQYDSVGAVRVQRAWMIPGRSSREEAMLRLAAAVLASYRYTRLPFELVEERQVATTASAMIDSRALASVFSLGVDLKPGLEAAVATDAMDRALARFLSKGPSVSELQAAIASVTSSILVSHGDSKSRADALASGELYAGNPAFLNPYLAWIDAATAREVRDVARRYLSAGWHQIDVLPRAELKSATQDVDRTKGMPPISGAPLALNFPEARQAVLSNGLRLVVAERSSAPMTTLSMQFDAGNAADTPDKLGLASFTLDMLDEGTHSRSARALESEARGLGAYLSISSDLDASNLYLDVPPDHLAPALRLWSDVIQNASFPADAFERLRAARLAMIENERSNPDLIAFRILRKLSFGKGHGYGIPRSGLSDEATIRGFTQRDLLAFRKDWLRPDNATLIVVGNTTLEAVRPLLEKIFRNWRAPDTPLLRKSIVQVPRSETPRVILVDRPGSPQSLILGGDIAPGSSVGNALAIEVMNDILGGSFTSRLNMNLREDKHWSYFVDSGMADAKGQRSFQIHAPVQTDKTGAALAELLRELKALNGERPISEAERASAIASACKQLPVKYETAGAVAGSLDMSAAYGWPFDYPNGLAARYQALTLQDLQAAANEVIDPQSMVWIIVGDRARIESQIASLHIAPVEHWTADGRPVQ